MADTQPKRTIWSQRTDDVGKSDSETMKIFEQLTGSGLVSTEQKKKGNFNRK